MKPHARTSVQRPGPCPHSLSGSGTSSTSSNPTNAEATTRLRIHHRRSSRQVCFWWRCSASTRPAHSAHMSVAHTSIAK